MLQPDLFFSLTPVGGWDFVVSPLGMQKSDVCFMRSGLGGVFLHSRTHIIVKLWVVTYRRCGFGHIDLLLGTPLEHSRNYRFSILIGCI